MSVIECDYDTVDANFTPDKWIGKGKIFRDASIFVDNAVHQATSIPYSWKSQRPVCFYQVLKEHQDACMFLVSVGTRRNEQWHKNSSGNSANAAFIASTVAKQVCGFANVLYILKTYHLVGHHTTFGTSMQRWVYQSKFIGRWQMLVSLCSAHFKPASLE